jgi:hypothetical protein
MSKLFAFNEASTTATQTHLAPHWTIQRLQALRLEPSLVASGDVLMPVCVWQKAWRALAAVRSAGIGA